MFASASSFSCRSRLLKRRSRTRERSIGVSGAGLEQDTRHESAIPARTAVNNACRTVCCTEDGFMMVFPIVSIDKRKERFVPWEGRASAAADPPALLRENQTPLFNITALPRKSKCPVFWPEPKDGHKIIQTNCLRWGGGWACAVSLAALHRVSLCGNEAVRAGGNLRSFSSPGAIPSGRACQWSHRQ